MKLLQLLAWLSADTDRSYYDDSCPIVSAETSRTIRGRKYVDDEGQITQLGRDYLAHAEVVAARAGDSVSKTRLARGSR